MIDKKMTRKEFFKMAEFGVFTVLIFPWLKKLDLFRKSYKHKEARYYEKLAG